MRYVRGQLPPDMKLAFFYDQSLLVRDSVRSVWEAIIFGLILSVVILFLFLKDWGSTLVAIVVIPVTVLVTLLAMRALHMTFNLMTLGGIASAIGLVIDDAIVVVEAIHTKMATGLPRLTAVHEAVAEIFLPLTGSTLTPVVVFIPLAFLEDVGCADFHAEHGSGASTTCAWPGAPGGQVDEQAGHAVQAASAVRRMRAQKAGPAVSR